MSHVRHPSLDTSKHAKRKPDTKLADRTAVTSTRPAADLAAQSSNLKFTQDKPHLSGDVSTDLSAMLASVREDLAEAQKMRAELQSRLDSTTAELEKLKEKSAVDAKRIGDLATERNQLVVRLRDRDEELRGKSKLLEVSSFHSISERCSSQFQNVQDELVSLNLQLNMSDDKNQKLKKENQDLVDRWMARMGKEADAMNDASKFS